MGYEIRTGLHFAMHEGGRVDARTAVLAFEGQTLATFTYAHAAQVWRINFGWRRRKDRHELGFRLDLERGTWASNPVDEDDAPTAGEDMTSHIAQVIPYVEDTRNCLLVELSDLPGAELMASLQAALKTAMVAARATPKTQVIVIDTTHTRTTEDGGWWWEVAIPEVSSRGEVRQAHAAYLAAKAAQQP